MNIFSKVVDKIRPSRIIALFLVLMAFAFAAPDWGFYGHRKINRMAVFTLPSELIGFYKKNIEFVTEHAVDPDKRRYATKHEAVRHYIDIDHWGTYPFDNLPRDLAPAFLKYAELNVVNQVLDTSKFQIVNCWVDSILGFDELTIDCSRINELFYEHIVGNYYEDQINCDCDILKEYLDESSGLKIKDCKEVIINDRLRKYGVLPYWLPQYYEKLVNAMAVRNEKSILRISAEMGHYIGDAHVPLHTTENYNGQFTDQVGIHAFWESRLPELFADDEYDFFVGKAIYVDDVKKYFWKMVLSSHRYLEKVLRLEKELSISYPSDQQLCFDERNERTIKTQCRAYSETYHNAMDGMVEEQMRNAILAIGSIWYSAWIDAGQPDLDFESIEWTKEEQEKQKELEQQFRGGSIIGRTHQG